MEDIKWFWILRLLLPLSFITFVIFFSNKAVKFINNYTKDRKENENRIKELKKSK